MTASIEARRRIAVEKARKDTDAGSDWQQIQWDLVNDSFYAPLFEDMTEDEAYEETMAIIREGEEALIA